MLVCYKIDYRVADAFCFLIEENLIKPKIYGKNTTKNNTYLLSLLIKDDQYKDNKE